MELDNNAGSLVFHVVHDHERWLVTPDGGDQRLVSFADLKDIFAAALISRMTHGAVGQWIVMEDGFDKPLASFDGQNDALEYADDLANAKSGSTVKVFDETGREMPAQGQAGMSR